MGKNGRKTEYIRSPVMACGLNGIIDKDNLKKKMAEECKQDGKMKNLDCKNFAAVFELIEVIKAADAAGVDHL